MKKLDDYKIKVDDQLTRRFVWYPLQTMNFSGTQSTDPLFTHIINRGKVESLEPVEYKALGTTPDIYVDNNTPQLETKLYGTDAQINFLATYYERGMQWLQPLDGVDYDTAESVEKWVFPDEVPATLPKIMERLLEVKNSLKLDTEFEALVSNCVTLMIDATNRATNYCNNYINGIEKEMQDARAGRHGKPSLIDSDYFFYSMVEKPVPDERAGVNSSKVLGEVLAKALGGINIGSSGDSSGVSSVEVAVMQEELDKLRKLTEKQGELLKNAKAK